MRFVVVRTSRRIGPRVRRCNRKHFQHLSALTLSGGGIHQPYPSAGVGTGLEHRGDWDLSGHTRDSEKAEC